MSLLWAQKLQSFYHKIVDSFLYSDLDPPPSLSFKINVDVVVGPCFSSIAAMARDRRGELVYLRYYESEHRPPSPTEAEAIKWALSLAPTMGNECIIAESGYQSCVQLLNDLVELPLGGSSSCALIWGICCLFLISFLWSGRLGCVM